MKIFSIALLLLTSAYASDSSNSSSSSASNYFSSLPSPEAIQEHAVVVVSGFLESMQTIPRSNIIRTRPELVAKYAKITQDFLPSGSDHIVNMERIFKSFDTQGAASLGNSKDEIEHSKFQAAKDIISALQSINLTELSFTRLVEFAKLLKAFSYFVNNCEAIEAESSFNSSMRALEKRKTELAIQASTMDCTKIGQVYGTFFQTLLVLLNSTEVNPTEINTKELSAAVQSLASVVIDHATLSGKEGIVEQVGKVVDMEKETAKMFRAWKKDNGKPEMTSEYSGSESSSGDN